MASYLRRRGSEYIVFVKTGERRGMGTDLPVFVAFEDDNGLRSRDYKLNNNLQNDFKHGQTDTFDIFIKDRQFKDPAVIEIWRDDRLSGDAWFCEYVRMENINSPFEVYMFPVNRWIRAGFPVKLKKYDTLLPQNDPNLSQRQYELEWQRANYQPVTNPLTGMIMVGYLPPDETYSISDDWDLTANGLQLTIKAGLLGLTTERWETFDDIEAIYEKPHYLKPMSTENWREDREFGTQRLSGCNPAQIRLCTEIPVNFALNEKEVESFLAGMTIKQAIAAKRLFIIDYKILKNLPCTNDREICAPLALFFVNNENNLMPVAIQLLQDSAPENPVFYPSDPEYTWLMAKCYFNLADASFHESSSHLGFTHLIGEIIVIATHRSLSPSHPIFRLLAPHFMYLLAINAKGMAPLFGEGGFPDKNMNIGAVGMAEIIRRNVDKWRLDVEGSLHADLKERGVSDPDVLPNYYYRDDALLLHKAISEYVSEIVNYHYDDAGKIDKELQEWCRFLGGKPNFDGELTGCIKGLPNGGKFETVTEIITVVTDVIFLLSAGHASVNFGQYDDYGFPPAYPAWMNGLPPQDKTPLTEADIMKQLPNKKKTVATMAFAKLLSTRGSKPLGDFEMQYIYDPVGMEALNKFRAELKRIGDVIDKRNETRQQKYIWLHPKEVPNSITI